MNNESSKMYDITDANNISLKEIFLIKHPSDHVVRNLNLLKLHV